ncbi:hypothetical protein QT397_00305 (plasmid) [Microbulbifer sp. MKSA007]|nr:hypothetical protein QT397_00305 [Microbulbifer sp. MKSA007]
MQDGQNKRKMRSLTPEQLLKLRQHTALKKLREMKVPCPYLLPKRGFGSFLASQG